MAYWIRFWQPFTSSDSMMAPDTPSAVAWRILNTCFSTDADQPVIAGLEPFQASAVRTLSAILDRRGGAILADSVGLGKTHVAVELIRADVSSGATVIVTSPAQLRAHWLRHLRGLPHCRWVSHTSLSRGTRLQPPTLVVVDEAHAFRNARTRRYAALALLCEHARVLLVTATPVNNSLLDFYHLVRLFAPRNLFMDLGVPDLLVAVESARFDVSATELRRVANAIMVRRTRAAVAAWQSPVRASPPRRAQSDLSLRFPECGPIERITYGTAAAWPAVHDAIRRVVPALTFPAHGVTGDAAASALMRLGLLKRLESSSWAFTASVRRHIRVLRHFMDAATDGFLFDVRTGGMELQDVDGATQLSLRAVALKPWPPGLDRVSLLRDADHDIRRLQDLAACVAATDPKVARLMELLDTELPGETVLIFTEFRETARGLWRALSQRPGVALVHGTDARLGRGRASRRAVIERFAPIANRCPIPREVERVRLLIATDLLAEGMNLQDASAVVSFDLPWNPVRLAQRVGRIDRLGSPHQRVRAFAFVPDRGMDEMLGLMKRIRRKLRHIRVVGGDAPWSIGSAHSSHVVDIIDDAAVAREHARAAWRQVPMPIGPRGDGPYVAVTSWNESAAGALCAFSVHGELALVLVAGSRTIEMDTARCWALLAQALDCEAGPPFDPEMSQAAARSARRAARALSRPRHDPRAGSTPARPAASTIFQWLSSRPGRPTFAETEAADAVLRELAMPRRAGAELRIEKIVAGTTSPVELARRLRRSRPDTIGYRQDRERPGDDPAAGRHDASVGQTKDSVRPRLRGVLLLMPVATRCRFEGP